MEMSLERCRLLFCLLKPLNNLGDSVAEEPRRSKQGIHEKTRLSYQTSLAINISVATKAAINRLTDLAVSIGGPGS